MPFKKETLGIILLLSCIAAHAAPGSGSKTLTSVGLGGCDANSVTIDWDLGSLMGEPTVDANFEWAGDSRCRPSPNTSILMKVQSGGAYGWVIATPVAPAANSGYGMSSKGSPAWNDLICSFSGKNKKDCFDADAAKKIWKNGSVTEVKMVW